MVLASYSRGLLGILAAVMITGSVLFSACNTDHAVDAYLIRVRDRKVTVSEFQEAVDAAAREAFPGQRDIEPQALNQLRIQVLNQFTEELVIMERGKDLGLTVSDEEVEKALATIKADYPDNTFEETLLENAISLDAWKKKLAVRLMIDKVVALELIDQVKLTPEDIAEYYKQMKKEDTVEQDEQMVQQLRRIKAEEAYQRWIDGLREQYQVEINQAQWKQLTGSSA